MGKLSDSDIVLAKLYTDSNTALKRRQTWLGSEPMLSQIAAMWACGPPSKKEAREARYQSGSWQ